MHLFGRFGIAFGGLVMCILALSLTVVYYYRVEEDKIVKTTCIVDLCNYHHKTCSRKACKTCVKQYYECGHWDIEYYTMVDGIRYNGEKEDDECKLNLRLTCYYDLRDPNGTLSSKKAYIMFLPVFVIVLFTIFSCIFLVSLLIIAPKLYDDVKIRLGEIELPHVFSERVGPSPDV